jgi:hypothetical protein
MLSAFEAKIIDIHTNEHDSAVGRLKEGPLHSIDTILASFEPSVLAGLLDNGE